MSEPESPAAMLASIGRVLYGTHWRRPLAAALGEHESQIRRYADGDTLTAEHALFAAALALLDRRAAEIGAAAKRLRRWRAAG